jgi:hypothetical protein
MEMKTVAIPVVAVMTENGTARVASKMRIKAPGAATEEVAASNAHQTVAVGSATAWGASKKRITTIQAAEVAVHKIHRGEETPGNATAWDGSKKRITILQAAEVAVHKTH